MIYIIFSIMASIVIFMIFTAHHDTIDYRTIQDNKLPQSFDQLCIFYISDVHRRKISLHTLDNLKKEIDIVMIGGDLTEKGVPLEKTRENLRKLKRFGAPVYFVWGNNDYEVCHQQLHKMLIKEGIIILKDSFIKMSKNDESFYVVGLDYYEEGIERSDVQWDCIDGYCLLLTHVPQDFFDLDIVIQQKVNTVLAGHTHGGQIRFFNLGFYQKGGFCIFRHTNVLISEGYGYTFLPFRLQTKAECHVLTFEKHIH